MVRLLILFASAGVVALIWSEMGSRGSRGGEAGAPESYGVPAPVSARLLRRSEPIAGIAPWRPPVEELNAAIREDTAVDRAKNWSAELGILAKLLRDRPHLHFKLDPEYVSVGGFERLAGAGGLADPKQAPKWRCRPIEVVGTLLWCVPVAVADRGLDAGEFPFPPLEGVLDASGQEVKFLWPEGLDAAAGAALEMPVPGGRYKIQGVFFRLADDLVEGVVEVITRPMVIAKKVVRALPLEISEPPARLPEDTGFALKQMEEEDPARPPHRDPAFLRVLGNALKPAENRDPDLLRGRNPLFRPDHFRLRPVRVRGFLIHLAWESFDYEEMREEDAPILGYWHAIVSDGNPLEHVPCSVAIPDPFLPGEARKWAEDSLFLEERASGPFVDITATYCRLHAFRARGDAKGGPRTVRLPLAVATAPVEIVRLPGPLEQRSFWVAVVTGIAAFLALFGLLAWRDRRSARAFAERTRHLRAKRQPAAEGVPRPSAAQLPKERS